MLGDYMAGDSSIISQSNEFLWIEQGQQSEGLVAEVAPILATDKTYHFNVPESMDEGIEIGQRVLVQTGKRGREVEGFVVSLDKKFWDSTLRSIEKCVDEKTFLSEKLIALGKQISRHYSCAWGLALKAMLPEAVRKESGLRSVRYAKLVTPLDEIDERASISAKRRAILESLQQAHQPMLVNALLKHVGAGASVLAALVKNGWVSVETRKELPELDDAFIEQIDPEFTLNNDQQAACDHVEKMAKGNEFGVMLLHGVSGSGKTEVYIHAIRRALARGQQAILLVPEIVLTTQLVSRLLHRLPDVALFHSGLTGSQRSIMWRRVAMGDKKVVIGTRSAVFAPCPNLGLICVDEEQEPSYKNLQTPRFHVRDVAIMRANLHKIPIVLGSATPSLETFFHARTRPDYHLQVLPSRVMSLSLPKIHVIDMRDEWAECKQPVLLSRSMHRLLGETLARKQQAMMLLNRRGFAYRVFCPTCKSRVTCPSCQVGMVVHAASKQCRCHYCNLRTPIPTICTNPSCGQQLQQVGFGTQRLEDDVRGFFPEAIIARVDSDTMTHRSEYERIVKQFQDREIDVLIGTQMIAKGLDFPHVSFVGVVDADPSGYATDFRMNERLFQLVTQVAGRAGRAEGDAQVVVQTTVPELPAMRAALTHDYDTFAENELAVRQRASLPPFSRIVRFILSHPREEIARDETDVVVCRIQAVLTDMALAGAEVLGPNACAMARIRNLYRYDAIVRTANASDLRRLMKALREQKCLFSKAKSLVVDVDPVSFS